MGKSKKKRAKVKRFVGSTPMDMDSNGRDSLTMQSSGAAVAGSSNSEGMDTSEVVVTGVSQITHLGTAGGRVSKKNSDKRKAVKLRKEKALMKALSNIDKEERRVTKAELKKFGKQELKRMD